MATKRLADWDKNRITRDFNEVLKQALNNKKFPIEKDDFEEWARSLLPKKVLKSFNFLMEACEKLVNIPSKYNSGLTLVDTDQGGTYHLSTYDGITPYDNIPIPAEHPSYGEVLAWAKWYNETHKKITSAQNWLETCVYHCHSMGQVARVLDDEILRFVPDHIAKSLGGAERRSRMPRGFEIDKERHEELSNMLALGSLSPKKRQGADIWVSYVE